MNTTPYANSLFEQPWWLDAVAPGQWQELLIENDSGEVIARMPYVTKGRNVVKPRLTQNMGIWMAPEIRSDYAAQKKVIFEIFSHFHDCRSVMQTLSPCNTYVLPFRWLGYRMEPGFTYRLTDLSDCDALYRQFHKTVKRHIKSAQNKTIISETLKLETLLEMLDKTFAAQNRKNPIPRELVGRIVEACEATGHGKYIAARDTDGNVHSCAYFVYDEQVCYYLLGASDSQFRNSGAQSLVMWEGIQFAAQHSKVFDFEGSMVEGIENFFRQFGGTCTPYYTVRKSTLFEEILQAAKPRVKRLLGYKL